MKTLLSIAVLSVASTSAMANTYVFDQDGAARDTNYAQGPITTVRTDAASAHNINAYIFPKDATITCDTAALFNDQTGEYIAVVNVHGADIRGTTKVAEFSFAGDNQVFQANKTVELRCADNNGEQFLVHHKVPGAPLINWTASVSAAGPWTGPQPCGLRCNPGHGSYSALQFQGSMNVTNNAPDGVCYTERDDLAVGLFHGGEYRANFHSDVFSASKYATTYNPPVVFEKVTCQNSAAKTTALKVWQITGDSIELVEDTFWIQ